MTILHYSCFYNFVSVPVFSTNYCDNDVTDVDGIQHEMTSKHGEYSGTMRLGRNLKDRCTKTDPERDVLAGMLEQLKNKWNSLRSGATQRYGTCLWDL